LEQLLNDVFLRNKVQSIWGSCKILKRKMINFWTIFVEDSTEIVVFVMLTKCCILCNQNGIMTFVIVVY
jgi:hypothetical protein